MSRKIKIELTEEQQTWLLRFLNYEWDAEVEYQWRNRKSDTTYLEEMLDVYKACCGKAYNIIEAFVLADDIEDKVKDITKLKESNDEKRITNG